MKTIELKIPNAKKTNEYIKVTAPYDGSPIAKVEVANSEAAEIALKNAYQLFKDKKQWMPLEKRLDILKKSIHIMSNKIETLSIEAAREGGKPLKDSRVEVIRAIDGLKICIDTMRTQGGNSIAMNLNASSSGKTAFTKHEPIGVVVAVSAFNHPLNLIVHQVAPAIATGCPVIIKPAEDTPLSCFSFFDILQEAGLPEGWVQPLVVKDLNVATQLVTDSRVAFFTFIGSAKVGWMLRSKLAPGTRCALEHGGAAPVIVAEDANLEKAIPALLKGGLYHAGQVCVSVQRIYAHKSIAEELAKKLAEEADKLITGDPTLEETDIGPLIRPAEVDRVEQWVNEAREKGAKVLCGGERINNYSYKNTILFEPKENAIVSQKEIFGPVINVYSYSDEADAVERANSLPYSFQASVFTQDIDRAFSLTSQLNASAVMINEHTAFRVDWMPFAGLNESGLGIGGIPYTLRDMQTEKLMVIKTL